MLTLQETFPVKFPWRSTFAAAAQDSMDLLLDNFKDKKGLLFLSGGADSEFLSHMLGDKVDYLYIDWGDPISKMQTEKLVEKMKLNISYFKINLEHYARNYHFYTASKYWAPTLWTSLYFHVASLHRKYDYFLKGGEITLAYRDGRIVANTSRASRDNDLNLISDLILSNPCTLWHIHNVMKEKNLSYDSAKIICYETVVTHIETKIKRTGFERFLSVVQTPNNGPTWLEEFPDFYFTVDEIYNEFSK